MVKVACNGEMPKSSGKSRAPLFRPSCAPLSGRRNWRPEDGPAITVSPNLPAAVGISEEGDDLSGGLDGEEAIFASGGAAATEGSGAVLAILGAGSGGGTTDNDAVFSVAVPHDMQRIAPTTLR